jgi:hypothetical protein
MGAMTIRFMLLGTMPAYGIIVVFHGHGVMPLAMGVPIVLSHVEEADWVLLWPSLVGTLGGVQALSTLVFPCKSVWFRAACVTALASLGASACGFVLASVYSWFSLVTAVPFFALWVSALAVFVWVDLRAKRERP